MSIINTTDYNIFIENKFEDELISIINNGKFSKIFILCDTNTSNFCLPQIKKIIPNSKEIIINCGEEYKTLETCSNVWEFLTSENADRKSLMINLGGGVVTDMGGFISSLYKRGISFINIPTTLLSQVDASVGGKLGIDFKGFKNQIGLFGYSLAVFIVPDFLKTLDQRQLISGYAEVIKHGLIYNKDYWNNISSKSIFEHDITSLIQTSIEIKNDVVTQDPLEKGLRKILNFGHTIGHAIESYSLANDTNPLLHGESIAIGMICESYLSFKINSLSENELNSITKYIKKTFKPYNLKNIDFNDLFELMKNDKKNNEDKISFSLLNQIGSCNYDSYVTKNQIFDSLNYYTNCVM